MLPANTPRMAGRRHTDPRAAPAAAVLRRDAALARGRRTRRWVIGASAALTAGFAALGSSVAPGRTLRSRGESATRSAAARRPVARTAQMPRLARPSDLGLQAPDQVPQAGGASQSAAAPPQQENQQPQPAPNPSQSQSAPAASQA